MNYQITLTISDILFSLAIGFALCLVYLYLLWRTILISQKSSHPILILFLSGLLRVFLLIFIALVCSQNNLGRFLLIFCGFLLTRFIVLKFATPSFKKQITEKEIVSHTPAGSPSKSTKKKKKAKRK